MKMLNLTLFYLSIPVLSFQMVTASLLTKRMNVHIENCSICLDPVRPAQYFKAFNCEHNHLHKLCAQNWTQQSIATPTCPTCRAPATPAILLQRECVIKILELINIGNTEYYRIRPKCSFSLIDSIKYIRLAVVESQWDIIHSLINARISEFNFENLNFVYPRVLEITGSFYYNKMMDQFLKIFSEDKTIFEQNKVCIARRDARCIARFLDFYDMKDIEVPEASNLRTLLQDFITRNPLSINESDVLFSLPRTFITMNTIGEVLNAQCHQTTRVNRYYVTAFELVVKKDLKIPEALITNILRNTVLHWSKDELEMVLQYKYLTTKDIQDELTNLNKFVTNRLFLSTHDVPWIKQKLNSYKPS